MLPLNVATYNIVNMLFQLMVWLSISLVLGERNVQPESVIQAEGLEAVFECYYPGALYHLWRIDGEYIRDDQYFTIPASGNSSAKLIIPAIPQYNNSVVQCIGFGSDDQSQNATLRIDEIGLPEIDNKNYDITIFWENPFTTNISFYVDIRSAESSETVGSVYISGTQYTFTSLQSNLCEDFLFTVTPTSGGNNGTSSQPVSGYFQGRRGIENIQCQQARSTEDTKCEVIFSTPLTCNCELMFSSIDTRQLPLISHSQSITGNGGARYILDTIIAPNRHYSVNVSINSSISSQHKLPSQNITTHDIIEAKANHSSSEGALNTLCTFVPNTTARGYLAVVSSRNDFETLFIAKYNTAGTTDITDSVGSGNYQVGFFDLENNGLPSHSTKGWISSSARIVDVNVPRGSRDEQHHKSSKMAYATLNESQICVFCSPEVHCLVLQYDPSSPDILLSLFVPVNESICSRILSQHLSVAFFGIDNNNSLYLSLEQHPRKVVFIGMLSSSTTSRTIPVTSTLEGDNTSTNVTLGSRIAVTAVAVTFCAAAIVVLVWIVLCFGFFYNRRRKKINANPSQKSIATCTEPIGISQLDLSEKSAGDSADYAVIKGLEDQASFDIPEPMYAVADSRRVVVKKGTPGKEVVDSTATQGQYVEISGYQHEAQVYAHVVVETSKQSLPNAEDDMSQVVYAVLDKNKLVTTIKGDCTEEQQTNKVEPLPTIPPKPTPLNTEPLHALLTPAASKWYELGLAMGFSEDTLEGEIYHGNSTDWLRLGEICGLYCQYKHSWEEVVHMLWEVEEWEIADKICRQERLEVEQPIIHDAHSPPSLPPKALQEKIPKY